jgi:transposase
MPVVETTRLCSGMGGWGMKSVDTIARVRREHFVRGKTIKEIVRDLHVSRNTVRKILRSGATSFEYERRVQPQPRLGPWREELERLLAANAARPSRERLTLMRLFEELRGLGYAGGYDAVRRYAASWRRRENAATAAVFVPLSFAPGEAYQFDWSHEIVVLNGVTTIVKGAHLRLCHSRMPFVRAYPRESQEMVFDGHDRAFAFFKGTCTRGIYDNMKTGVDTVFVGKARAYNRRFLQMCAHYLVEPVACTPAAGWEKGQVENQVGVARQRLFTPRLRFKSYEELNAWLLDRCVAWAKAQPLPRFATERSGRCSRPSGRAWCPMPGGSTASTRCPPRSPRPAWYGSTTTSTRSRRAPSAVRSRSGPTPTGSSSARTAASSVSTAASSAAVRPCMIPGTTCRCWRASRARSGMGRSSTGCYRRRSSACAASSAPPPAATGRWWTS